MSDHLVKWAVELSVFNIQYKPRLIIKSQVLVDFIVECTIPDDIPDAQHQSAPDGTSLPIWSWIIHVEDREFPLMICVKNSRAA